jgi:hypothetical protein
MLNSGLFESIRVSAVLAIHQYPKFFLIFFLNEKKMKKNEKNY